MLSWTICWIFSCGILLYPIPLEFILRGVHVTTSDTTPFRIPKRTRRCGWNSPDLCPGGIQLNDGEVQHPKPPREWPNGLGFWMETINLSKCIGEKLIPPLIGESWWWVHTVHSSSLGWWPSPNTKKQWEFRPHRTYGSEVSASWETKFQKWKVYKLFYA